MRVWKKGVAEELSFVEVFREKQVTSQRDCCEREFQAYQGQQASAQLFKEPGNLLLVEVGGKR